MDGKICLLGTKSAFGPILSIVAWQTRWSTFKSAPLRKPLFLRGPVNDHRTQRYHTCQISGDSVACRSMDPSRDSPKGLAAGWSLLGTPASELRLEHTMPTGQSFRWISPKDDRSEYLGVLGNRVMILRQLEGDVAYKTIAVGEDQCGLFAMPDRKLMEEYFNLRVPLTKLSETWSRVDPIYKKMNDALPGARMLRQDPVECLFSFICSQNNHISRIHGMVNKLCRMYGTKIEMTDSDEEALRSFEGNFVPYTFPTLEQLADATEWQLRENGFGYRAKFIVGSVQYLLDRPEGGREWLMSLREVDFEEAVEELCQLPGVGPKVAACAALFSLDKHSAIPVDTHVWQFSNRHYTPHLKGKAPSPKYHPEVQAAFVERFGEYAGWAHNTLFISELAHIKKMLQEMKSDPAPKDMIIKEEQEREELVHLTPPKADGGTKRRRPQECND